MEKPRSNFQKKEKRNEPKDQSTDFSANIEQKSTRSDGGSSSGAANWLGLSRVN